MKISQEMHQGLKKTVQQCSGKIKKLGWIIGRLNTVQEKLVEVGRNWIFFFKPWILFLDTRLLLAPQL